MILRRHKLWMGALAALAIGLIAGAAWPPPPLPKLAASADNWSLPAATDLARHVPQDMAAVTANLRWKGDVGGTPDERTSWRLAGIVHEAGPAILVMTPDSKDKAQRIEIGGTLPDGSVLQSVQADRAATRRDNCITTYQLFQAQPVDRSSGCEEPEASDQGTNQ